MKKLVSVMFLICTFLSYGQVKFEILTWKEALKKAKKENKYIFLSGCTPWSEPCQLLDKYTLTDLEVTNFYNGTFINIKLDMEEYPGIELAEIYNINTYPAMLFVNGNGDLMHRGCGAMDAGEFLELGKIALGEKNLGMYDQRFENDERGSDFLLEYLELMEEGCVDAERFANSLLGETKLEDLVDESKFLLLENYQWDIFSREFQYLKENKELFEKTLGKARVHDKMFNTYLAQYQQVFESEELHLFGMRALLNEVNSTLFIGSDTLLVMMNLHYFEIIEDWSLYADNAVNWVGMTGLDDPEELSDLAWKFYLFVDNPKKLEIASNWAKLSVDLDPNPSSIDTYASLVYKQGNKKKAIELEKQALQMVQELLEDASHYEHQLAKFQGN